MKYPEATKINQILASSNSVVIVQADNPDGDSLASSLALEQIIGDMGKEPTLYCGIDMPSYLGHLDGWDRVTKDLPHKFDASIIVDTAANDILTSLERSGQRPAIVSKPCIVLDHHLGESTIPFATIVCNKPAVATGEVIYELAQQLGWPLNRTAKEHIAVSILSDSLGLTSESTTARSIHILGELVEQGVSLAKLADQRSMFRKKSPEVLEYKGRLLQRVEYAVDGRLAHVTIPWDEIQRYSPSYNPSMLVLDDMRLVEGVDLAIAFKAYNDGRITAKLRTNFAVPVAKTIAEAMGGGGHPYAAGFKVTDGRSLDDVKHQTFAIAAKALEKVHHEAV